jgi:hypothetical protein
MIDRSLAPISEVLAGVAPVFVEIGLGAAGSAVRDQLDLHVLKHQDAQKFVCDGDDLGPVLSRQF